VLTTTWERGKLVPEIKKQLWRVDMLLQINNNREAVNSLRHNGYGDADFEVTKKPLWFQDDFAKSHLFPNKKGLVRTDNGQGIAVVSDRYKALQFPTMIDKSRDMIERCNLDATGVTEQIQVSPNSGMCLVNYTLPAKEYKTPDGDTGCVTVMALSSHDGKWKFELSIGFRQSACLNGQIFAKNPANIYQSRHNATLDIDRAINLLGKTANVIEDEIELWHDWHGQEVSNAEVLKTIEGTVGEVNDGKNKNFLYILNKFVHHYAPTMGKNKWALYNALTDWSTHAPTRSKNKITLTFNKDRAEKVQKTLQDNFIVAQAA